MGAGIAQHSMCNIRLEFNQLHQNTVQTVIFTVKVIGGLILG